MQPNIGLHGVATPPRFNLRVKHHCPRCSRAVDHYDIIAIKDGSQVKTTYLSCPLCKRDIAENYPCRKCNKMVKNVTLKLVADKANKKEEYLLICSACKSELLRISGETKQSK